ncbi:hypothetical protein K435DRAFT_879914 [Dendrothele bispora CBS 962.96]|uniref:Uncharacterized protein n=1 Tax=Dendrothele bispora (strain CBS 962.96) TaxID=1314807 RepID=A0A4S8KKP3_DENBC|nr:hypothetical protein K435DRAFT_879914 [Dendrothele bispora CBS 962.96]
MSSTPTDRTEFVSIGQDVFLRRADAKAPNAETDPEVGYLVVVVGIDTDQPYSSVGAKLAHIHKYTKKYEELYPAATQIFV